MSSFTQDYPEHIGCHTIYDALIDKYRPIQASDFAGGVAGTDAFGRQRVSNPEMIFNSKQIFDNQPLYWDDIQESGSGTSSTYSNNTASSTLSVSASTAGKRTRQTFMRFNYQPSKSQLIFITGILKASGGGAGIISRMGYFDDNNGLFLECNAGTINLVRRTYTGGSASDNTIPQSSWNLDKMDGTGASKITLDFTKTQIFMMDFEWLGVGRVRFGFNIGGVAYYVHELSAANDLTTVYMSTPNLPIRYQIINDGTGIASSINCICSAVISEGGREEVATNGYVSTGNVAITATKNVTNAILATRLKSGYLGATIDIIDLSLLTTSNDNYQWQLYMNPSGLNGLTYSDINNSALEYAIAPNGTAISGGFAIAGGYAQAKTDIQAASLKSLMKLGSSITGRKDVLVLSCLPLGSSDSVVYGSINYREFN
ncbi:MAG: Cyanophage [Pseudomonadota bacterium]|jgi:hypothetical protein